jgi:hypothetical protein
MLSPHMEFCMTVELEQFDGPPAGWFALDVSRATPRKWDWLALMVDVDHAD